MNLPSHYEKCLGPIVRGWSDKNNDIPLQIVCFDNCPERNVFTLATLGLSLFSLRAREGKRIHQELLMSANVGEDQEALAGLILSLAESVVATEKPLLRGEVIGPGRLISPASTMDSVFVTNPSPLPSELLEKTDKKLVFAYLIPVYSSERSIIKKNGWDLFEYILESRDPDIWNMRRPTLVL